MPWVREEVAPYCYENVYQPSCTEQFYYSTFKRTPDEMNEIYQKMNGRPPRSPYRRGPD